MSRFSERLIAMLEERAHKDISYQVAGFLALRQFMQSDDSGPADLSKFRIYNNFHGSLLMPGDEVDEVRLINPTDSRINQQNTTIYNWEDEPGFPNDQ